MNSIKGLTCIENSIHDLSISKSPTPRSHKKPSYKEANRMHPLWLDYLPQRYKWDHAAGKIQLTWIVTINIEGLKKSAKGSP